MRKACRGALAAVCALLLPLAACSGPAAAPSPQTADEKTELRMACAYACADLTRLVSSFNGQSGDYTITLVPYDRQGGRDLLLTEIAAGTAPDLFAFYSDFLEETDASGAYEDLLPYFDGAEELREALIPSLFEALTKNGHLYWLPYDFAIDTYTAQPSVVGDANELTMEKAKGLAQGLGVGVFPPWQTREELFSHVIRFSMSRFIDGEARTCRFDSPDFIALLEQCGAQPAELPASDDVMTEKSLLRFCPLQQLSVALNLKRAYGDDYCFVGFPTENGGKSLFCLNLRFGVYARSENQEGAWAFLLFTLNGESQENADFLPVTRKALDAMIEKTLTDGQTYLDAGLAGLEQSDIDKVKKLIEETTEISALKAAVFHIMTDAAQACFHGDRTAGETANEIQSRVSLYLAEQD